eukprot:scaffold3056_cov70-Phaeocystis_antarctica.AAC.1
MARQKTELTITAHAPASGLQTHSVFPYDRPNSSIIFHAASVWLGNRWRRLAAQSKVPLAVPAKKGRAASRLERKRSPKAMSLKAGLCLLVSVRITWSCSAVTTPSCVSA